MVDELGPQFSEDEDLERAKAFWKENGNSIIAGIVLGVGAIGGYNGWQYWQKSQGESASTLYQNIQDESIDFDAALGLADDLAADYASTPYAIHAALLIARRAVEQDNLEEAASRLEWALSNTDEEGLGHIARIRLAMVMLAMENPDRVLSLASDEIAQTPSGQKFASRYAELRGDALVLKGELEAAGEAYQASLLSLPDGAPNRALLQLKFDNLGI